VRKGKPDTVEHNRDRSVGVSVYWGERPRARRGHASTSDFSAEAVRQTVEAAAAIARHTAEDDCAGLPEAELLAREAPDLDLFHPWSLSTEEAIDLARRCEAAAFAVSKNIRNSEGATVSSQHSQFVLANSLGFVGGYPGSRHWLSCSVIAEHKGLMQRSGATRRSGRWRAWAHARSRPPRRPCCSRRRRRCSSSGISSRA
jgi:PmbA protein